MNNSTISLLNKWLFVAAFLMIRVTVYAQESTRNHPEKITINLNAEAFAGLELGYQHAMKNSILYTNFNVPLFLTIQQKKLDTWEMNIGINIISAESSRFLLKNDLQLFCMRHQQILGTFIPVGFELRTTPAIKSASGYVGIQIGYNQIIGTHVAHSDLVRNSFENLTNQNGNTYQAAPNDGWYSLTGNSLKYGIETQFNLTNKLSLLFDLGILHYFSAYTKGFDSMMYGQVPFFMDLQLQWSL